MRIRFFGFLANACKKKNVEIIRTLLSYQPEKTEKTHIKKDIQTLMLELTGVDITLCQKCKKGRLQIEKSLEYGSQVNSLALVPWDDGNAREDLGFSS